MRIERTNNKSSFFALHLLLVARLFRVWFGEFIAIFYWIDVYVRAEKLDGRQWGRLWANFATSKPN